MNKILLFVIVSSILAGCSSLPGKSEPVRESYTSAQQTFELGESQYNSGQYESAYDSFDAALFKFGTLDNREGVIKSFLSMGQSCLALGQFERALICYDWAMPMARALKNEKLILDGANHYGQFYLATGDIEAALEWSKIGEGLAGEDDALSAEYYRLLGNIARKDGDYLLSLEMYSRALEIDLGLLDSTQVGTDYYLSGSSYSLMENYPQAEAHLQLALKSDQYSEFLPGICADLTALGIVSERQGKIEEAILYYQRAAIAWKGIYRGDKVEEMSQKIVEIGEEPIVFP